MGYKSFIRSIEASVRQAERSAIRQQKDIARRQKEYGRLAELERAAIDVEEYENRIEQLLTIHQDCSASVNWEKIQRKPTPLEPKYLSNNEDQAKAALHKYQPSLADKLFKTIEKKRKIFEANIETAKSKDQKLYLDNKKQYEDDLREHNDIVSLAEKVLSGNSEGYLQAIKELDPFSELSGFGSSLNFIVTSSERAKVELMVKGESAIPKQIKSLLKSGKLSVKDMPAGKFNELYQDYVCSAVLRIGRELFSLLPLKEIIVTAKSRMVDSVTGHLAEKPILSVLLVKETLSQLNFQTVDPSDSMKNFKHNMGFKKSQGMVSIDAIDW